MMFAKISTLVVLVLCLLAGQSEAQGCVAESVVDMRLEANHNLVWFLRPGEPCEVSHYLIYIFHPDQPAEHELNVTEPILDVSFLEICEEWIFVVIPVSGDTLGGQRRLSAQLPLPADADLSVAYLNMTYNETSGTTHLTWNLTDNTLGNCSIRYRVTVEEIGNSIILNDYVNGLYTNFYRLPACTTYQFSVRALNTATPGYEGPLLSEVYPLPGRKQQAPPVVYHTIGSTWIDFTVRLETPTNNPCPLYELYIDAGDAFSRIISLADIGIRRDIEVSVISLEPSTEYTTRIWVVNSVGISDTYIYRFNTTSGTRTELYRAKED